MENQNLSTKTMLTYGLYLGISTIIVSLLNYSFGNIYEPHWSVQLGNFILLVLFIVLGIKIFRDTNAGLLKLSEAIKIGLGISLIGAMIGVIYLFLFIYVIEPDFMTKLSDIQQQTMYEKFPDMPEEQLEQTLEMSKKFTTPTALALMSIVMSLFLGLIISLISGLILKKEESIF